MWFGTERAIPLVHQVGGITTAKLWRKVREGFTAEGERLQLPRSGGWRRSDDGGRDRGGGIVAEIMAASAPSPPLQALRLWQCRGKKSIRNTILTTGNYKSHWESLNKSRSGYFKNTSGEIPSFKKIRLLVVRDYWWYYLVPSSLRGVNDFWN